ncbi:MAG: amidohydrolase family protein [Oscillospiraceae bacterium]|nr:amidohydrolase family protein [Oscillospiraceae bacterium]MBQ6902590.1 amidohydrolase family protein [Oscillospiraceae bacterium]
MKFDVHCHAFPSHGFIKGGGKLGESYFLSVEQQLEMFKLHGVDAGLLLPLIHYEIVPYVQKVKEIEETAKKYPDKFIYFMNLDPRMFFRNPKADFSRLIEYHLERGARGVGEMCANLPWEHPLMDNMLFYINKYKLPLTIHISPIPYYTYGIYDDHNLSGLERVLNKYPDIKFFGHSAEFWSRISGDDQYRGYPTGSIEPNGPVVRLLETYPHLYGDLSAGSGLNAMTRDPAFTAGFLEKFQDQLMFGLDFCKLVPEEEMTLSKLMDGLLADGTVSKTVYDKICWNNAAKNLGFKTVEEQEKQGGITL